METERKEHDTMKKIKLIALDMDGTLLNSEKKCSERTKRALIKAQEQGIWIVPTTGRAINGLPQELKDVNVRYGIFCNGASCYDLHKDMLMVADHFTVEEALKLLHIGDKYDASHDVYAGGCGYCEAKYLDHFEEYTNDIEIQNLIRNTRKRLDGSLDEFLLSSGLTVEKVNMFFKDLDERAAAEKEFLATGLTEPVSALYNNLEMGKLGVSKGKAMVQLAEKLGIEREEIMACGDAKNDFSMVKLAGIGVAMKNGIDEIKEIADYVTDTNDCDGVAKAIEKFALE